MPTLSALLVGNAERHALLLETEHIQLEFRTRDFLALEFDHAADTMLGINDIIADNEAQRLCSHLERPFCSSEPQGSIKSVQRERPGGSKSGRKMFPM